MMNDDDCSHILREMILKQRVRVNSHSYFDWKCLQCGKIIEFSEDVR